MATYGESSCIASVLGDVIADPMLGAPHLTDDRLHTHRRHQRIPYDGRYCSCLDRRIGHKGKVLSGKHAPIAAVNEDMDGRSFNIAFGEEQVELLCRVVAVSDIKRRAQRRTRGLAPVDEFTYQLIKLRNIVSSPERIGFHA